MNPGMITALAYLLSEAIVAGVSISTIVREARQTGRVPPEKWEEELAELDAEVAAWKAER